MKIREKFELSDGMTILVCSGCMQSNLVGKKLNLVLATQVRQTLTISSERIVLNQKFNLDQRIFETSDRVFLSEEEAQSGEWELLEI